MFVRKIALGLTYSTHGDRYRASSTCSSSGDDVESKRHRLELSSNYVFKLEMSAFYIDGERLVAAKEVLGNRDI